MSREDSPIHGIVKRLADKYGFLWHKMPNFPLSRNAAIVLVASTGDKKMFSELSDKCGVWNQNEQTPIIKKSPFNTIWNEIEETSI